MILARIPAISAALFIAAAVSVPASGQSTPAQPPQKTRPQRGAPPSGGRVPAKPALPQQGPPQAQQAPAQQGPVQQGPLQAAAPQQGPPPQPVDTCPARLAALGLETRPAPAVAGQGVSCLIQDPVVLTASHPPGEAKVTFTDQPLLSCAMADAFGVYVRDIVTPMAKGLYGQPVTTIGTGPGFECRTRNHVPGAKVSSHAQGNALDIALITLGDGAKISIGAPADERTRRFIFALRAAGCGAFSTALGPGSDAAHATHLHFDIEARGRDGKSKFCQ